MSFTTEEKQQIEQAEQRRREKAKEVEKRLPQVPSTTEFVANAFSRITELRKAKPLPPERDLAKEEAIGRLWSKSKAPDRHVERKTSDLRGAMWLQKFEELKPKVCGKGVLLAFVGIRGPGKTQMAVELMRHQIVERQRPAEFCDAIDIFISLRTTYGEFATRNESAAIAEWCRPDLLVIDELQERGNTPWEDRLLAKILNNRYNSGRKDTILIGNMTVEKLKESVGLSIWERLVETGGIILFDWPSFRISPK